MSALNRCPLYTMPALDRFHCIIANSGVPQQSISGPLLSISISVMFFEAPRNIVFPGYADDNSPCTHSSNMETVLKNLKELFHWSSANHFVVNANKCHLLTSSKIATDIHISDATVSNVIRVKLLGLNL